MEIDMHSLISIEKLLTESDAVFKTVDDVANLKR